MEKINWSVETTLEFIELYKKKELIWNPRHPKHVDRAATYDSWKELATHFGLAVLELKRKKDSLLASYRKCKSKKLSTKGETGWEDYQPTWFAYEALDQFLGEIYTPRGVGVDSKNDTEDSGIMDNNSDLNDSDFEEIPPKIEFEYHSLSEQRSSSSKVKKEFKRPLMNRKRKLIKSEYHHQLPFNKTLKLIKEAVHETNLKNENKSKDQCKLFTDLLCERLRHFDDYTRDIAMHEIDNIIFRLKNPNYVSSTVFSSSAHSQTNDLTEPLYVSTFSPGSHTSGSVSPKDN